MTISEMQEIVDELRTQYRDVAKTARQVSLTGSHAVTNHALKDLRKEISFWERRIRRAKGIGSRVRPNYGGTSGSSIPNS